MDFIATIPPQFHSISLLVAVLLIKFFLQTLAPHQPWQFFSFFCQQLANKVNKQENGEQQQRISGFVATIITFTPLWVILWLFADFVEVTLLWQGLLLYFALGSLRLKHTLISISEALNSGNKYRAKQLLQPLVKRDTQSLSPMGIAKASIEMVVLRYMQEVVAVIALFLVGGALLALSYRIILEMHYAWNPKLPSTRNFGRFAHQLTLIMTWLPSRTILLIGLLLSFGQQSTLLWRLSMPYFFKLSNDVLIQFFALALNIKLAGVAMYDGVKLRRTEFNNQGRPPEVQDIKRADQFLDRIGYVLSLMIVAYYTLWWAGINSTI